jgi:hypothetical protein
MDWIEQLFGASPDGGDGTTELLIVLASTIVLAGVIISRVPWLRERFLRLVRRGPADS